MYFSFYSWFHCLFISFTSSFSVSWYSVYLFLLFTFCFHYLPKFLFFHESTKGWAITVTTYHQKEYMYSLVNYHLDKRIHLVVAFITPCKIVVRWLHSSCLLVNLMSFFVEIFCGINRQFFVCAFTSGHLLHISFMLSGWTFLYC